MVKNDDVSLDIAVAEIACVIASAEDEVDGLEDLC